MQKKVKVTRGPKVYFQHVSLSPVTCTLSIYSFGSGKRGKIWHINPAGTLCYIYVVFMLRGHVKIMLGFMLECLVFLT